MSRFSWKSYDKAFLKNIILKSDLEQDRKDFMLENYDDDDIFIGIMNMVCRFPDKRFIMDFRTIIEQELLKFYPEIVNMICKALNIHGRTFNERQSALTRKPTSQALVDAYVRGILDIGGIDVQINEYNKFRYTVALNMKNTVTEEVPLYDYQKKTVSQLKKYYIDEDQSAGLLVMPTGSGKSRTASYFLISEMISRGYQVLWIAHRHMLLNQAADCFEKFAGLVKVQNPNIKNYRISCISGEHLSIKQVDKHEVIIASVSSICRSKAHLSRILGRKVIIVVDEAHHALAPSYNDTIKYIQKHRKNTKLLGLTATPIRANDRDSNLLRKIFCNKEIFNIPMCELIAKGILSIPDPFRVSTGVGFEDDFSDEEKKLIQKYKELPESAISKIASSSRRNAVIVKTFLDNKEKFGKTLIFALNILHAQLLCEELKNSGIECETVYSGKENNQAIINDFKENRFKVLINVNIMSEGTDVPDIETVFLTRPTQSEVLLLQMIGRGMRGKAAHGTERLNVVDFNDKWETFTKWLNPTELIYDEKEAETINDSTEKTAPRKTRYEYFELKDCIELYNQLKRKNAEYNSIMLTMVGWYSLIDYDGLPYKMLVFEDQLKGMIALKKDKQNWISDFSFSAKDALKKYFRYFCSPPSLMDIEIYMDNVRNCEEQPILIQFEERKKVDPYYICKSAEESGKDVIEYAKDAYRTYTVASELYPSEEEYLMAVCKAKIYGDKTPVIGSKVEELPIELVPFKKEPKHDLERLVSEVKQEMFSGTYEDISSIEWTDTYSRCYYGIFYYADNSIKINKVLNSESVPEKVVKFVIYHEMLHRDYRYHDAAFKSEEHKYKGYEECEHFLYDNMTQFDIKEW